VTIFALPPCSRFGAPIQFWVYDWCEVRSGESSPVDATGFPDRFEKAAVWSAGCAREELHQSPGISGELTIELQRGGDAVIQPEPEQESEAPLRLEGPGRKVQVITLDGALRVEVTEPDTYAVALPKPPSFQELETFEVEVPTEGEPRIELELQPDTE
jgi:hypothetical protein